MREVLAMLRPFMPFGMCAVAAAYLAYLLTRPLDYTTAFIFLLMGVLLAFPLLMRWHYQLLVASLMMPINLFFVKGSPPLWLVMMALSLGISVIERATSRSTRFIHVPQIFFPLIALSLVVFFTAELTGGMGFRALGSDVYGGKKYAMFFAGIIVYFALTTRPIPLEKAKLYASLFLLGSLLGVVADFAAVMPHGLRFIYLFISPSTAGLDEMGEYSNLEFGVSRLAGVAAAALGVYYWMLAQYGVRGIFLTSKVWRIVFFGLAFAMIGLGGYRSAIMQAMIVFACLFFMEKLHRTPLIFVFLMGGILLTIMIVPLASKLPYVVQRGLSFLPLEFNPDAIAEAKASSDWRMDMWTSLLPEVPKHLLLGKGFGISTETFNEMMDGTALASDKQIDSSQQPLALSGDYHNGPLSVILPFGIWGAVAFVWFMAAVFWVLIKNYQFGDPALKSINRFILAYFAVKVLIFATVFGAIQGDICAFASLVGLSVAFNHGVCHGRSANRSVQSEPFQPVKFKRALPTAPTLPSANLS